MAQTTRVNSDQLGLRVQACTVCHGKQGRATPDGFYPRIAGKPSTYLHQQLLHFRDGRRLHHSMNLLLANLSDAYLLDIAQYFSQLDLPYVATPISTLSEADQRRGSQLAQRGDVSLKLPACVQCHGEKLTGVAPAIPGLLGLPRDYLVAQLGAWRNKSRQATAPDCMATIAQQMSPADIAAVTSWLAAQPIPADPKPALATERLVLPMACGSVPELNR